MADLNYEQFMVESPSAAEDAEMQAIAPVMMVLPKKDNKDSYLTYLFDWWED